MTYTITITEPGAEPVSVSLEWNTEAPTAEGYYIVDGEIVRVGQDWGGLSVFTTSAGRANEEPLSVNAVEWFGYRWLGPIPLPPK